MIRYAAILILLLSGCAAPPADPPPVAPREVSGVVQGELFLSGAVVLAGDLLVPAGSRLVIAPGTVVTVQPTEATKIDPEFLSSQVELLVRGTLQIDGSAAAPVLFTVAAPADEAQWAGILLDGAGDSRLRHLRVEAADTGVLLVDSAARIEHLQVSRCRYGVVVQGGRPTLSASSIVDGEGGLYLWNGAAAQLNDLLLADNGEEGLFIDRDSRPQLTAVRSERNALGAVAPVDFDLSAVQFSGNGEAIRRLPVRTGEAP